MLKSGKLARLVGADLPTVSIMVNKIFNVVKGPISFYFIVKFLNPTQQGYWYTFGSLGALTVFAELGFTVIITQYVSHEFANLSFSEGGKLTGDDTNLDRFYSLIRHAVKFYFFIVPLAFVILTVVGCLLLRKEAQIELLAAWCLYSLSGALNLFASLFQSIYQGCDKIYLIQKNILLNSLFSVVLTWILLFLNCGIWSLVASTFMSLAITTVLLYRSDPIFWSQLLSYRVQGSYQWFRNIVPLQFKYGISWIAGYFIFRLFVPVVFKYQGPEAAGKIGMSFMLLGSIIGFAHAWGDALLPKMNIAVARKNFKELRAMFIGSLARGLVLSCALCVGAVVVLILMKNFKFAHRFVAPVEFVFFSIAEISTLIITSMARVLRAYKDEPYYSLSLVNGAAMAVGVFFVVPRYGVLGMSIVMTIIQWLLVLPLAVLIYRISLKKYQEELFISNTCVDL